MKCIQTSFLVIAALAALVAQTSAANAATIYTTSASFLAQVRPGSYTEAFQGNSSDAPSFSFLNNGFGYTVSAPLQSGSAIYLSGSFIGNLFANSTLTITFTSGAPTALGGNFYITNASDAFIASAPVTINLSDGTSTTFTPGSAAEYRGFTSTAPISSLVLSAPGSGRYNTVDNLTVGLVTAVPEPSVGLLMALGMAGIGCTMRRRPAA